MRRREFLKSLTLAASSIPLTSGFRLWPDEGFRNPCLTDALPPRLSQHPLMQEAWEGINPKLYRDWHVHLIGIGDQHSGILLNPAMQSYWHPQQRVQFSFYLNGSCADEPGNVDQRYIQRLQQLMADFPTGAKFNLLSMAFHHDDDGHELPDKTTIYVPASHAVKTVAQHTERFLWSASIHPYQSDALEQLQQAIDNKTCAIKWLPPAMNIDPSSPRCDAFYRLLAKHKIPLLCHTGDEHAVDAGDLQKLGNPLLLRHALEHGVSVIMAHCASMGSNIDTDKGAKAKEVANIDLFARLMADPNYDGLLYGEISAVTQVNREKHVLEKIVTTEAWQDRLLYGSDYPLPGVMPVFSPQTLSDWGFISKEQAGFVSEVRQYNPLMFDFLLKRLLRVNGQQFANEVFANPINAG